MIFFLPIPYIFAHLAAACCFAQDQNQPNELQVWNSSGLHFTIFAQRVSFISLLEFLQYTKMY